MCNETKKEGKWYAAICASPFEIFKKNNISEGEKITWAPKYAEATSDFVDQRVVVSENT